MDNFPYIKTSESFAPDEVYHTVITMRSCRSGSRPLTCPLLWTSTTPSTCLPCERGLWLLNLCVYSFMLHYVDSYFIKYIGTKNVVCFTYILFFLYKERLRVGYIGVTFFGCLVGWLAINVSLDKCGKACYVKLYKCAKPAIHKRFSLLVGPNDDVHYNVA